MSSISLRNNVRLIGNGDRTIILAHGFGCDQAMWRYILPFLEKHFRVLVFDYVGCGRSDITCYDENRYGKLTGYAQDIIEICEELSIEKAIFIGHSVSSMIGVLAYIERPKIFRSMVMICPSSCYLNTGDFHGGFEKSELEDLLEMLDSNYIEWANYLAPVVMKNHEKSHLSEELAESFCSMDKSITKNFARVTFFSDNRKDLNKVDIPCLIVQCTEDDIANQRVGQFVKDNLPNSKIVNMDASGHCPHLSHPQETIDVLKNELLTEKFLA
ncbi:alpha/beta hydrolase [Euzebyella marina]|uniref:Alpha/beta hydrolase n=1 Tax=Euzebyella marina TaxID=1761453 RepID=A0A3G2L5D5_9FLAO|nr:alpha/beta hydrolase [Euzebyella marina]AYN67484.1 alpha/beta hydrolase [Euzebyella marina]